MDGLGNYSLEMFGRMFADRPRHRAYAEALERTVKPGDVVLDIGTGIGIYAMLAARLGAGKVYAVEINPHVRLGEELAEANGLADRIEFIQALSTDIELPEPADVIVADLRGVLPYFDGNLASLEDAASRHLASGGVILPSSDRVVAALATNRRGAESYLDRWLENGLGLDLGAVADRAANTLRDDRVEVSDLLTEPFEISRIDYADLGDTGFSYSGTVATTRAGLAHGLSVWFEATVLEELTYGTGPDQPPTVYGMAFMPFRQPAELDAGADLQVEVSARQVEDDYVWSWSAAGRDAAGKDWRADQTTFRSATLDPDRLRRRKAGHRPQDLSADLEADLHVLQLLRDGSTLGEAADALAEKFPELGATPGSALTRVADLADRYER